MWISNSAVCKITRLGIEPVVNVCFVPLASQRSYRLQNLGRNFFIMCEKNFRVILIVITFSFANLPWPAGSSGKDLSVFESSCHLSTSLYHTQWRLDTVPLGAEGQAGGLQMRMLLDFGLTRRGIEPESTVSVANHTQPWIGSNFYKMF